MEQTAPGQGTGAARTPRAAVRGRETRLPGLPRRPPPAGGGAKKEDAKKWLSDKGAPWAKLANEKPKGETIAYDTLLNAWKAGKVR